MCCSENKLILPRKEISCFIITGKDKRLSRHADPSSTIQEGRYRHVSPFGPISLIFMQFPGEKNCQIRGWHTTPYSHTPLGNRILFNGGYFKLKYQVVKGSPGGSYGVLALALGS